MWIGDMAFAFHGIEELRLGGVDPVSGGGVMAGFDFIVAGRGWQGGFLGGVEGGRVAHDGAGNGGDFAVGGERAEFAGIRRSFR